ncbi:MAG: PadR family transcriptional regulator [Firmicutes bacterium]|jgi:DNA-binding PadR family transcriptional regulator|nr:PadR family transcriptional regulator [Bacillota bacterium]HKM17503.1 helix-turn-helix transcriptional regulator [Limnochordia bacterium]
MRDNVQGGALTETTFLIMLAVFQPMHGYGIMQFIEAKTHGRVILGAGTLYGALKALKRKGWIRPCQQQCDSRQKRYVITEDGITAARQELNRLKQIQELAISIIGGAGE